MSAEFMARCVVTLFKCSVSWKDYVSLTIERSVPRETHGCLSDAVSPVGWDVEGVGQPNPN